MPEDNRGRGVVVSHGDASIVLNRNGSKLFISLRRGVNKVTMTLTVEEALVIGQYLNAYAQSRLATQGLFMGGKPKRRIEGEEPEDNAGV